MQDLLELIEPSSLIMESRPLLNLRGPVTRPDGSTCVGKVAAPPRLEATSSQFHFWIPPDALVEKTQLVTVESEVGGRSFIHYAMVEEVYRCSRKRSMAQELDESDSDLEYSPHDWGEGYTYASATVLRTIPALLSPPREGSDVLLAGEAEARFAYSADEIDHPLAVGLIKNGGSTFAGPGYIDLDYLLGANGGHMNVNGAAGRGTKSSFLLTVNWLLLREARRQQIAAPSAPDRLRVVPIILNVKNFDLFFIDRASTRYNQAEHRADWQALGVDDPAPFHDVSFYAPQEPGSSAAIATGRPSGVLPYSWALRNIIEASLFPYIFAEVDSENSNFSALILDIDNWLGQDTAQNDGSVTRQLRTDGRPTTFQELLNWVDEQAQMEDGVRALRGHVGSTWKKLQRRLLKLLYESRGVLRRDDQQGWPLQMVRADTTEPIVVDLASLAGEPELQRFVVATILRQLVDARTGPNAVQGLVYLVTLDELNRFAPRGAKDPITLLVETVAAEMRSQGIILLGAQQQASRVSERVIENAAIKVLGKSGSLELSATVWRFLSDSARRKAESLRLEEKLILQDNFREPMHVRVPFPAWAMRRAEARDPGAGSGGSVAGSNGSASAAAQHIAGLMSN
jgi:uncharacterized protein